MGFFDKMNDGVRRMMVGRNGGDTLTTWVIGAALIASLINIFFPNVVCSMLSWALLFYGFFRLFSRDVAARRAENEKFESLIHRSGRKQDGNADAGAQSDLKKQGRSQRKDAKDARDESTTLYFTCDQCGQQLSVPRGKGTLKVTCPKCKHQSTIKS